MNNACPNCGAIYAVNRTDEGFKLRCKRCGESLIVCVSGLVLAAMPVKEGEK
jgi:predicted Zn finger-like uncharacterized protein